MMLFEALRRKKTCGKMVNYKLSDVRNIVSAHATPNMIKANNTTLILMASPVCEALQY